MLQQLRETIQNTLKFNIMKTLSIDFFNENNFFQAVEILTPKNFDSFLLNITIQVPEHSINTILFELELNNIKVNTYIY